MGSYSIAPFSYRAGRALAPADERALEAWVGRDCDVLQRYWDGDIAFTEDAIALLQPI